MSKYIRRHAYLFNPQDNGGESLVIVTDFFDNGDGVPNGIVNSQTLTLSSYGNSASFNLSKGYFTPENLRLLADELESVRSRVIADLEKK